MTKLIASLAGAVAALMALTGCAQPFVTITERDVATVANTPTPTPTVDPSAAVVRAYVDAAVSSDPDAVRAGMTHAAPGSRAAAYLTHLAHVAEAQRDAGRVDDGGGDLTQDADGFDSCYAIANECTRLDGFVMADGKVSDLNVNGESPGPRITLGKGRKVGEDGATFTFLSAYRSIEGNALYVTVDVATRRAITVGIRGVGYQAPNGRYRHPAAAFGPTELGARSRATVAFVFRGVGAGGTVRIDGCSNPACSSTYDLYVRVAR